MIIKEAQFVISSEDISKCPKGNLPEFAFIGRSNVGKSSLINMLTQRKYLAKVSGTPGKTKLINHFLINRNWYLVDLPGYGFAKVSRTERDKWEKFIRKYLVKRENLYCVFVLVDSRLEPQKNDLEFMQWLGEKEVPFVITYTKTDKLGKNQLESFINVYKEKLLETWDELPEIFSSSAETGFGREEILNFIEKVSTT